MKVIDLLNKIANGEINQNNKYQFSRDDYCNINNFFERYIIDEENLNLEIIEEKKIPEKMDRELNCDDDTVRGLVASVNEIYKEIADKYNEIIDYIKSKGE